MMKFAKNAMLAAALCGPAAATGFSSASSQAGETAHFTPESIIAFAKKVEKTLAAKGARVAVLARMGRPASELPEGMHFTHVGFAVYSQITTADGRRMLVLHGDRFDGVIACAKWLAYVGDSLYTMILKFNQYYNAWRARMGLPYWSLSQYLKLKVKNAVSYITSFEHALAAEARKQGVDGVICGHIHKPEIRDIDGILYCNDGDWVEILSALVEERTGELKLVDWHEVMLRWEQAQFSDAKDEACALPA
jgi:hypothetical protein